MYRPAMVRLTPLLLLVAAPPLLAQGHAQHQTSMQEQMAGMQSMMQRMAAMGSQMQQLSQQMSRQMQQEGQQQMMDQTRAFQQMSGHLGTMATHANGMLEQMQTMMKMPGLDAATHRELSEMHKQMGSTAASMEKTAELMQRMHGRLAGPARKP